MKLIMRLINIIHIITSQLQLSCRECRTKKHMTFARNSRRMKIILISSNFGSKCWAFHIQYGCLLICFVCSIILHLQATRAVIPYPRRALFCMYRDKPESIFCQPGFRLRHLCINIIEYPPDSPVNWMDRVVMFLIVTNCITMAIHKDMGIQNADSCLSDKDCLEEFKHTNGQV